MRIMYLHIVLPYTSVFRTYVVTNFVLCGYLALFLYSTDMVSNSLYHSHSFVSFVLLNYFIRPRRSLELYLGFTWGAETRSPRRSFGFSNAPVAVANPLSYLRSYYSQSK